MANLFEVAVLNWVNRSKSELRRKIKRFRSSTILEANLLEIGRGDVRQTILVLTYG
jgi:hypothetical protein